LTQLATVVWVEKP